jgi:bacterioferritin-associated ferredoxin
MVGGVDMYVCICHAVTDAQMHDAVDSGADSVETVCAATGAGGSCRTCHDGIEDLVDQRSLDCPLVRLLAG